MLESSSVESVVLGGVSSVRVSGELSDLSVLLDGTDLIPGEEGRGWSKGSFVRRGLVKLND